MPCESAELQNPKIHLAVIVESVEVPLKIYMQQYHVIVVVITAALYEFILFLPRV